MDLLDVVIVGAGPAGSTAARLLKQKGFKLKIVDKAHFPRFKPCAYFAYPEQSLEDAQINKMEYVCRKLELKEEKLFSKPEADGVVLQYMRQKSMELR